MYLVAIMDWYSRYVLSWRLSNTLEGSFCLEALEEALELGKPSIFNSDQGVQFTGLEFTGRLEAEGIAVSHDGRGRALDNVFVERLWRSVKYEDVYITRVLPIGMSILVFYQLGCLYIDLSIAMTQLIVLVRNYGQVYGFFGIDINLPKNPLAHRINDLVNSNW